MGRTPLNTVLFSTIKMPNNIFAKHLQVSGSSKIHNTKTNKEKLISKRQIIILIIAERTQNAHSHALMEKRCKYG